MRNNRKNKNETTPKVEGSKFRLTEIKNIFGISDGKYVIYVEVHHNADEIKIQSITHKDFCFENYNTNNTLEKWEAIADLIKEGVRVIKELRLVREIDEKKLQKILKTK